MKKHSTYLFLIILLALLGCEKDSPIDREEYEGEDNVNIELSTELISFSPGGGTEEITVNTGGSEWSVSSNKTWCVVSKEAGKITITAAANDEEVDREDATVTVTSGNVSRSIIIRQSGTKSGNISYTISDETKFLTSADMSNISEGEGWDKLVYTSGTPVNELPEKDDILLLSTPTNEFPNGFVKRVVAVGNKSDDGSVVVTTMDVPFENAFAKLDIDTTSLDLTNHVYQIIDANGNQVRYTQTRAVSQGSLSITLPSDIIEFGSDNINFTPSIDVKLGMRLQTVVHEKELLMFNLLVDPDISLGADFTADVTNKRELEKKLMTIYMNPIPVGPIIITPYISFSAIVRIDGTISFTASISYEHALTVGAKYETGDWNAIYRDRSGSVGSDVSPINYGSAIRVNGGVGVGIKTRVGFGLYGNLLSGDLGITTLLRGSGELTIDLEEPIERYWLLSNMNLQSEFLIDADVSLSVMGEAIAEEEIPGEISIPIDTLYLIPELQEQKKVKVDGRNVDIELECKRRSVFDMKIIGEVHEANTDNKFEVEFLPEGGAYKPVNNSDIVKLTKRLTNLNAGETYIVNLFMVVEGNKFALDHDHRMIFKIEDESINAAAKAILSDIYNSAGGSSWNECNWFDTGVEIADFEGVTISGKPGEMYDMSIYLREEWQLTGDMNVGNHTANINLTWSMNANNNCHSIVVHDMKCRSVGSLSDNSNLERLEVHSPHFSGLYMSELNTTNLMYLDVSGTAITEIAPEEWVPGEGYQPVPVKLKEVNVDNCPNLEMIHLDGGTAYTGKPDLILTLSADNCPKMKLLQLDSLNIDLESGLHATTIRMKNSTIAGEVSLSSPLLKEIHLSFMGSRFFDKLRIADNPLLEYVNIDFDMIDETIEVGIDELTLLNCNSLLEFKVYNLGAATQSLVRSLNVANCSKLDRLDARDLKLRELTLSNLPALTRLFVKGNLMTGLMLPVFDEVRGKEYGWSNVSYDVRYFYEWGSDGYTDTGVGYWYDGEPDRGYHIR